MTALADVTFELGARLLLEYLRVVFSPQVIAGVVIIFFLARFRPSIEAAFARLTGFKGAGIEASFDAQRQVAKQEQDVLREAQHSPKPEEVEGLQTLARWWAFERIWRMIYKSQVQLLRYLQSAAGRKARWNELIQFHHQGLTSQGVPPALYPYENYMLFLRNMGLIAWTGDPGTADVEVTLTDLGQEFLGYIATNNYNLLERPY
jgi:hypothetical protein